VSWQDIAAWRDGRRPLGSRLLFHVPAEIGRQIGRYRISLYFDHASNGYTARPNPGLDAAGIRLALPL
jgi:hypothetical protein